MQNRLSTFDLKKEPILDYYPNRNFMNTFVCLFTGFATLCIGVLTCLLISRQDSLVYSSVCIFVFFLCAFLFFISQGKTRIVLNRDLIALCVRDQVKTMAQWDEYSYAYFVHIEGFGRFPQGWYCILTHDAVSYWRLKLAIPLRATLYQQNNKLLVFPFHAKDVKTIEAFVEKGNLVYI